MGGGFVLTDLDAGPLLFSGVGEGLGEGELVGKAVGVELEDDVAGEADAAFAHLGGAAHGHEPAHIGVAAEHQADVGACCCSASTPALLSSGQLAAAFSGVCLLPFTAATALGVLPRTAHT
ncbi:hypothetical protein P1S61_03345 [Streptomyces sp. ME08-AFT2]|uniref:hypothetical protein n=1 Tax=Streptomyces sp. ME08-AFT2 TaxID=3028683 RepID=UPI0029ACD619|nr:hypothetical protein [Streptomyces sp. ME08-AFT2]MDX3308156.1 hypothetical protein [Streptomyces sp. ME08-AFT2]